MNELIERKEKEHSKVNELSERKKKEQNKLMN